jgi:hypothetical protein
LHRNKIGTFGRGNGITLEVKFRMIKISLIFGLILMFLAIPGAKATSYAGVWALDMQQSKNLPRYYENVKSHKLTITQDDKLLNVAVEISRGQTGSDNLTFVYNLDGSESRTETPIRTQDGMIKVPTTLKAVVLDDGKLEITITRDVPIQGQNFKGISIEDWALSANGKVLTIHRADDTPRGKMEADMLFVRN